MGEVHARGGRRHGMEVSPARMQTASRDAFLAQRLDGRPQDEAWWREIFRGALRRADAEAARALMVGDDPATDAEGAQAAGMQWLRLDWSGKTERRPETLTSLPGLSSLPPRGSGR